MQSEVLFKSVHANRSNQPTSQTFLKWNNFVNICLIELKHGKPDLHPHIELQTSLTSPKVAYGKHLNKCPMGTTMRPCPAVELTDGWAGRRTSYDLAACWTP